MTLIQDQVRDQVSGKVVNEVWSKVGEAFNIDMRLIEPSDTLSTLSKIDSWDLGNGEDTLTQWMQQESLGELKEGVTMLDLAKLVESNRSKK
jgi:hypothetical protein